MRQLGAAEQLVARRRALLTVLVLDVELQHGGVADTPVEGQRGKVALTVGVFDVGVDVFVCEVGAQSELLFAAEEAADVGGQVTAAAIIGGDRDRAHIGRPLGHVIDQPTGFADPALKPRQTLEQFHLLFVFQADILLAGDGPAIDLVAAGRIQRETTDHEIFVVADRRIALAHRGIVFQHVAEQAGLLVLDQCVVDHRDRRRRVEQRRRFEPADRGLAGLVSGRLLGVHGDRRQQGFSGL